MTVLHIDRNRIKVILTDTEVISCFGAYERLCTMSGSIKSALNALLRDIITDYRRTCNKCKIVANIRAKKNCGCEITLSAVGTRHSQEEKEYIYDFADTEDLTRAILQLYRQRGMRSIKSSLYKMPRGFRLLIKSGKSRDSFFVLNEFCLKSSCSHTEAEYTREHGKPLITETAVKKYGSVFFKAP